MGETRAELVPHVRPELPSVQGACSKGFHTTRYDCDQARRKARDWAGHCSEQPCKEDPRVNPVRNSKGIYEYYCPAHPTKWVKGGRPFCYWIFQKFEQDERILVNRLGNQGVWHPATYDGGAGTDFSHVIFSDYPLDQIQPKKDIVKAGDKDLIKARGDTVLECSQCDDWTCIGGCPAPQAAEDTYKEEEDTKPKCPGFTAK